jgi:hypothetical protein
MLEKPRLNKLAKSEERLYSPEAKFDVRPRRQLKDKHATAAESWAQPEQAVSSDDYVASLRRRPGNPFAKVFVLAFAFFLLAAGYGFWKLGPGATGVLEGTEDIRLSVVAPSVASGGEEYAFDVVIQNLSPIGVRLADLVVEMPPGTRDAETLRQDLPRLRIPIGDIAAGETRRQTVAVGLFGDEGERRAFNIRLEYRAPNSATIFEKERGYEVALSAAPVLLTVDALSEITPGQPLKLVAKVSSNSTVPLGPIGLQVDLPFGFKTDELSESPREEGLWVFDKLEPGDSREVTITGRLDGAHGDMRIFRFVAGALDTASSTEVSVPYGSRAVEVAVARPFFDLILALDGEVAPEVVRAGAGRIAAKLSVVNNTNGPIRDAKVRMNLTGLVLDERTVETSDGVYRSADNAVYWDQTTMPKLEEISPGGTVQLSFSFQSLPLAKDATVFANPKIIVDAEASGKRVYDENVPEQLVAKLLREVKILSNVEVTPSAMYVSGAVPPKVDTETVYRITWALTNTSNDIDSGTVSAVLPPLVSWVGNASAPENVSYDPNGRRVIWQVGSLPGGAGYGKAERRASFDISFVPSITDEGEAASILGRSTFTGNDLFAGASVEASVREVSTDSVPGGRGKIAPNLD